MSISCVLGGIGAALLRVSTALLRVGAALLRISARLGWIGTSGIIVDGRRCILRISTCGLLNLTATVIGVAAALTGALLAWLRKETGVLLVVVVISRIVSSRVLLINISPRSSCHSATAGHGLAVT